jgi:tRNA A-37 threonylcarbamoyl transferase component Bud32/TolB-like protein
MTPDSLHSDDPRWEQVWSLFDTALDLPTEDRPGFLERETDDAEIRREVTSLLAGHEKEGGILDAVAASDEELEDRVRQALEERYGLVRELGRGGMSRVYLAWEKKHQRRVVIKVLLPEFAARHGTDRFQQEVKLVAHLSHPNIISLIDSGVVDGLAYYVMPYLDGETLRARLGTNGSELLPTDQCLSILLDVAGALAHAHSKGVVHRDLKPGNVLLAGPHSYLFDFGVARTRPETQQDDEEAPVTQEGAFIGTLRYAAPEQAWGLPNVDHRADLYAWGVMAHELLTGRLPPNPSDPESPGEPALVTRFESARPDMPEGIASLIRACLDPSPARRPQSAAELLDTLQSGVAGVAAGGTESSSRSRAAWLGLGMAAIALLAVVGIVTRSGGGGVTAGGPGLALPVAVAAFENQTGDPSLDVLGRFAGDWITQGLERVEAIEVVPWTVAYRASDASADDRDPVASMAERTGAGSVVVGSLYDLGGTLQFRAEVVDVTTGRVVAAPAPLSTSRDSTTQAIQELADRISGSLAIAGNSRLARLPGFTLRPPTFEAYQAFDLGFDRYVNQQYGAATDQFMEAWSRDTTFISSLVYAAYTMVNSGELERADSLVETLEARRPELTELEWTRLGFLRGYLDGDAETALRAAQEGARLAPQSRAGYNLASMALNMNRPRVALEALQALDPDQGEIQGWAQYWTQLAHAHHLLGDHEAEAGAAQEMQARYPDRRIGLVLEVRARAAAGELGALETLLEEGRTLSDLTYWSLGAAMVVAGEEMKAHGHEGWGAYLERGRRWLQNRLEETPDYRSHRYWLASAAYDLREWDSARSQFRVLSEEVPTSSSYRVMAALSMAHAGEPGLARDYLGEALPYNPGAHAGTLARLAALEGDADRAGSLLSRAFQQRYAGFPWIHASGHDDFAPVADDPLVQRLLQPGG